MQSNRAINFILAAALFVLASIRAQSAPEPKSTASEQIEIRGKVVCLLEEMHTRHALELSAQHDHQYALKTSDGKYFTLVRGRVSEAIFSDARIRAKELILRGRVFPGTMLFEPSRLRSVRNGVVYDLFYYCDVCSIETVSPAECVCCRGPVELTEKQLDAPGLSGPDAERRK
jgi:hypothetical protein